MAIKKFKIIYNRRGKVIGTVEVPPTITPDKPKKGKPNGKGKKDGR